MSRRYRVPSSMELVMEHVDRLAEVCGGRVQVRGHKNWNVSYVFPTKKNAQDFARRVHDTNKGRVKTEVCERDPSNTVIVKDVS